MAKNVWGPTGKSRAPTIYPYGATQKVSKVPGKIGMSSSQSKGKELFGGKSISKEFNKGPMKRGK